ncbi:hypothetical protein SUGI_0005690 [Cryptomeria japonica]|nr:hypothetical protein SUGI_0005690 [Cryptomeria japonica]
MTGTGKIISVSNASTEVTISNSLLANAHYSVLLGNSAMNSGTKACTSQCTKIGLRIPPNACLIAGGDIPMSSTTSTPTGVTTPLATALMPPSSAKPISLRRAPKKRSPPRIPL